MAALRTLTAEKSQAHRRRSVGRELKAITLHTPPALHALSCTAALTENFLPAEIMGRLEANRLVRLLVTSVNAAGTLQALPSENPS
jgi:hypothetical protein